MKSSILNFERPDGLEATKPAELRGIARDEVRLLVSSSAGHTHSTFRNLADFLEPGDLLIVNRSGTLAASLPASGPGGEFVLNLSTNYGSGTWLAEPRFDFDRPGPMEFEPGEEIRIDGQSVRMVAPYPGLSRLWYVHSERCLCNAVDRVGMPIRYGYVGETFGLDVYQTLFSKIPGSAEMPSAARPFTPRVIASLRRRGIKIAGLTLHTGVSSLEIETDVLEEHTLYAEPYEVPRATAREVNRAQQTGRRVIAVGTTVVRALESAWNGCEVVAGGGFTRLYIHPQRGVHVVDGLVTGLHDPMASHLAMLYAIAGEKLVREAYDEAVRGGYLWHEFGDSHLILGEEGEQ